MMAMALIHRRDFPSFCARTFPASAPALAGTCSSSSSCSPVRRALAALPSKCVRRTSTSFAPPTSSPRAAAARCPPPSTWSSRSWRSSSRRSGLAGDSCSAPSTRTAPSPTRANRTSRVAGGSAWPRCAGGATSFIRRPTPECETRSRCATRVKQTVSQDSRPAPDPARSDSLTRGARRYSPTSTGCVAGAAAWAPLLEGAQGAAVARRTSGVGTHRALLVEEDGWDVATDAAHLEVGVLGALAALHMVVEHPAFGGGPVRLDFVEDERGTDFGRTIETLARACAGRWATGKKLSKPKWRAALNKELVRLGLGEDALELKNAPLSSCGNCKGADDKLSKCAGCAGVAYCSKECQA
ncbi:hypothetical protein T484DRAFT_3002368 [Baffinella frigidus]|nr:hypothetical protein T484DRAFT_3002368 [Cryptophyta sp. CCMP2293]